MLNFDHAGCEPKKDYGHWTGTILNLHITMHGRCEWGFFVIFSIIVFVKLRIPLVKVRTT